MFILCEYVCVWGGICVYLYMGTMHTYVYIVCVYIYVERNRLLSILMFRMEPCLQIKYYVMNLALFTCVNG